MYQNRVLYLQKSRKSSNIQGTNYWPSLIFYQNMLKQSAETLLVIKSLFHCACKIAFHCSRISTMKLEFSVLKLQ